MEIEKTIEFLIKYGPKKVALQFPDELLEQAPVVSKQLQSSLPQISFYIMADTTFGSCCVDEVSAKHANVDLIIHYGNTCLSPTSSIPVYYVFGEKTLDVEKLLDEFRRVFPSNEPILIASDVEYQHYFDYLKGQLVDYTYLSFCPSLYKYFNPTTTEQSEYYGREFPVPIDEINQERYKIFFIGDSQSKALENFVFTFYQCDIWNFEPQFSQAEMATLNVNRKLMKRFLFVEKIQQAETIGILIGTMSVGSYMKIIRQLQNIIRNANKTSYVISVGKLNPAKLANFPEIDLFVLVACPETSIMDSKEYYQPIVTPYELGIALGNDHEKWCTVNGSNYLMDFNKILDSWKNAFNNQNYSTELIRNSENRITKLSLENRTWIGLDQNESNKQVEMATIGRIGVARGYSHEKE